jgi:hypothetical protein
LVPNSGPEKRYLVFDRVYEAAIIIEDGEVAAAVVERMLAAGVPVYADSKEIPSMG